MSVLDRVRSRYESLSSRPVAVVPEWGDESGPLVVFSDPWTVQDQLNHESRSAGKRASALDVVIAKARHEDGSPLFEREHKPDLLVRAELLVVMRIADAIQMSLSAEGAQRKIRDNEEMVGVICELADRMKVPPHEIREWPYDDLLLMLSHYRGREKSS